VGRYPPPRKPEQYLRPAGSWSTIRIRLVSVAAAFGYNAAMGEYGDMIAIDTTDPANVTRLGLRNAAAIASFILTADCITF
jgi:chaperonin GroEL